ncbi:MAG: Gfo/Idh/MocA family oxidoreductase [Anaerolineaceae bacterium]|nr:Gfo/Idh/MocA family oxidoreductase [Anaerolineaceae bacterium]
MTTTRWGIIGTGGIAANGASAVHFLPDAELVAVGSRSQESADRFGNKWHIPHRHPSYEALVHDLDVDAVYVATPHPFHQAHAMLALNAGKHVLLEKPLTINAREAEELIRLARAKGLFLMEAMWTRFVPANVKMWEMVRSGIIGDVHIVIANQTFDLPYNLEGRLYHPDLAGGALLDLGVYPISYASWLLGKPSGIQSQAFKAVTGVDERNAVLLSYDSGASALLTSTLRSPAPCEATIIGPKGSIRIHHPFYCPAKLTIDRPGQASEHLEIPYEANGFHYDFAHLQECVAKGLTESPVMPLDESLQIMKTMDSIRAQWGLKYPME